MITANRIPDHATIARFRARHEQALAATFTQVLGLCAQAGLVSVRVVALDGSLLAGNASPGATRSYASIQAEVERMLAEAAEADAGETSGWARCAATSFRPSLPIRARAGSGCVAAGRTHLRRGAAARPQTRSRRDG